MVSKASTAASCSLSSSTIPASRKGLEVISGLLVERRDSMSSANRGAENGVGGAPGHGVGDGVVRSSGTLSLGVCCLLLFCEKLSGHRAGAGRTGRCEATEGRLTHRHRGGSRECQQDSPQGFVDLIEGRLDPAEDVGDPLEGSHLRGGG